MNFADGVIAWTIRSSMVLYVAAVALQWRPVDFRGAARWTAVVWTVGYGLAVLHVLAAFHFVHDWSHGAAYRATAAETLDKVGVAVGAGVYFNYLFLLVWGIDVGWTWLGKRPFSAPTPLGIWLGRGFLLFIAFNGVVVFKSGWLRFFGLVATVILVLCAFPNLSQMLARSTRSQVD